MSLTKRPTLSPQKLAANRANAQRSTGPRTPLGKARASLNALKHAERSAPLIRFMRGLGLRPRAFFRLDKMILLPGEAVSPLKKVLVETWLEYRRGKLRELHEYDQQPHKRNRTNEARMSFDINKKRKEGEDCSIAIADLTTQAGRRAVAWPERRKALGVKSEK